MANPWSITFPVKKTTAVIDQFDEGISPVLYRDGFSEINGSFDNPGWNLLYKGSTAVELYLVPNAPVSVKTVTSPVIKIGTNVYDGYFYYFSGFENRETKLVDGSGKVLASVHYELNNTTEQSGFYIQVSGTTIYVRPFKCYSLGWLGTHFSYGEKFTISDNTCKLSFPWASVTANRYNTEKANYLPTPPAGDTSIFGNGITVTTTLTPLSEYDRTDSTLLKIISLPYPPIAGVIGSLIPPDVGSIVNDGAKRWLQIMSDQTDFGISISSQAAEPSIPAFQKIPYVYKSTTRSNNSENKIFHSSFYRPRFNYDSFSYDFRIEDADPSKTRSSKFQVEFYPTRTINSRFLFVFPEWGEGMLRRSDSEYPGILTVARNNEEMILNSAYLDYIRSGYNYDVKAKNRAQSIAILSGAAGVLGGMGSIGMGIASGNPLGVVTGAATLSNTLLNTANSIAASEDAINAKKTQLENSAVSVAGSDDLDLMKRYCGNRARLYIYQCSDRMKAAILDLFYYCGYATTEHKTPVLDSREWFNFIQADLDVSPTVNIPADCLAEILSKYAEGATVFHKQTLSGVETWDLDQNKENWEAMFFA